MGKLDTSWGNDSIGVMGWVILILIGLVIASIVAAAS